MVGEYTHPTLFRAIPWRHLYRSPTRFSRLLSRACRTPARPPGASSEHPSSPPSPSAFSRAGRPESFRKFATAEAGACSGPRVGPPGFDLAAQVERPAGCRPALEPGAVFLRHSRGHRRVCRRQLCHAGRPLAGGVGSHPRSDLPFSRTASFDSSVGSVGRFAAVLRPLSESSPRRLFTCCGASACASPIWLTGRRCAFMWQTCGGFSCALTKWRKTTDPCRCGCAGPRLRASGGDCGGADLRRLRRMVGHSHAAGRDSEKNAISWAPAGHAGAVDPADGAIAAANGRPAMLNRWLPRRASAAGKVLPAMRQSGGGPGPGCGGMMLMHDMVNSVAVIGWVWCASRLFSSPLTCGTRREPDHEQHRSSHASPA